MTTDDSADSRNPWVDRITAFVGIVGAVTDIASFLKLLHDEGSRWSMAVLSATTLVLLLASLYVVFAKRPSGILLVSGRPTSKLPSYPGIIRIFATTVAVSAASLCVVGLIIYFKPDSPEHPAFPTATSTIQATTAPTLTASDIIPPTYTARPPDQNPNSPTPTPTPKVIFSDDFLGNTNHWELPTTPGGATVDGFPVGGELTLTIECPSSHPELFCNPSLQIPGVSQKDFILTFHAKIVEGSVDTETVIAVYFRIISGSYYGVYYNLNGGYSFELEENGRTFPISVGLLGNSFDSASINEYGISAQGNDFKITVNGSTLYAGGDANIDIASPISLAFHVSRGGRATITLYDLLITDER